MFILTQPSVPWQGKNLILSHIWISLSWWKLQLTLQPKLPLSQRPAFLSAFWGCLSLCSPCWSGRHELRWEEKEPIEMSSFSDAQVLWCPACPPQSWRCSLAWWEWYKIRKNSPLGATLLIREMQFPSQTETLMGVHGEMSGSWAGLKSTQIIAPEEQEHKVQRGPVQRSTIKTKSPIQG